MSAPRMLWILSSLCLLNFLIPASLAAGYWPSWGYDIYNSRNAKNEHVINTKNVRGGLKVKWKLDVNGADVSATPAVVEGFVYFPDADGWLWKVKAANGQVAWKKNVTEYIKDVKGIDSVKSTIFSRTTPTFDHSKSFFIIGTNSRSTTSTVGLSFVLAINVKDGSLKWRRQADTHRASIITQSPTFYIDSFYIGVSSWEEGYANNPSYPCCSFRGSMLKINARTGKVAWKTYMAPDNKGKIDGFSGNAIWGSSPSIDPKHRSVFIATGNNYDVPESYKTCVTLAGNSTKAVMACGDAYPTNYVDSILALSLDTGKIKWAKRFTGYDVFTVACKNPTGPSANNCPNPAGEDYDFGQAPIFLPALSLVIAGQKSGYIWAVHAADGSLAWGTQAGPGDPSGGIMWGSASDGSKVFTQDVNAGAKSWTLIKPYDKKTTTTTYGVISSLDAKTGKIQWQAANPLNSTSNGPITIANGVVLSPSADDNGNLLYYDAKNGQLLGSNQLGGTNLCGPAVADGVVYSGSGYGVWFVKGRYFWALHP
ncbi:hypothetical protein HDV00_004446 [Rhizophlyctis rosea]|nr:hypothetical protein HDV00_004446 [Rhizophlyctis rosea]